jgi:hypothetical protein
MNGKLQYTYTFTRQFFLWGPAFPMTLQEGQAPLALPHVEECTFFQGVKSSWGIKTVENKGL